MKPSWVFLVLNKFRTKKNYIEYIKASTTSQVVKNPLLCQPNDTKMKISFLNTKLTQWENLNTTNYLLNTICVHRDAQDRA